MKLLHAYIFTLILNFFLICCHGMLQPSSSQPRSEMCVGEDISCSSQFQQQFPDKKLGQDFCMMTYYPRNSSACHSLLFEGNPEEDIPGKLTIQPYLYRQKDIYTQTAFTVTFSSIGWQFLRMRFQRNGSAEKKNFCRDFHVQENVKLMVDPMLFYDCLWSRNDFSDYESSTYDLEVMAKQDNRVAYKKFAFTVPPHATLYSKDKKVGDMEVFLYIEISRPSSLVLHFQTLPESFGVKTYSIKMMKDNKMVQERIIQYLPEKSDMNHIENIFQTPIGEGNYIFTVQPIHDDCPATGCKVSKSPNINVVGEINFSILAIFLVIVIALVVLGAVLVCTRKGMCSRKEDTKERKVLFIYKSTHGSHVNVIDKLAEYMESTGIKVLLDRRDIKKSANKDPYQWYVEAFEEAEVVLVFSSLQCCSTDTIGIHRRIEDVALVQLKGAVASKKHRFASILLPYCKRSDIPSEASHFHFIQLPAGLENMLSFIHGHTLLNKCVNHAYDCFDQAQHDKNTDEKLAKFKVAVKEAVDILPKHKVIENEAGGEAVNLTLSDDELDVVDTDVMIKKDSNGEQNIPENSMGSVYPNLQQLNLMGEDFNQLIPSKVQDRQRKDELNGVSLNNLKL